MKHKKTYDDRMKTLGERIKSIRTRLGLSKVEFCRRIGMSSTHILNCENGRGMNVSTLMLIADALGVPASTLLEDGDPLPCHVDVAFSPDAYGDQTLPEPRFELRMDFELVSK